MNRWLQIRTNNIALFKSTEISGTLIATDILKTSDERMKRIVSPSSKGSRLDLDKIKKINIRDFTFCNDKENTVHKGVVAQELQKIIPEAVLRTKDQRVVECINRYCEIDEQGRLLLDEKLFKHVQNRYDGLLDLAVLPKHLNEQNEYQRLKIIDHLRCHDTHRIMLEVDPPVDPVYRELYVVGVWDTCLTVNYEYLYMMGLNVIKDLCSDMTALKQEVQAIKSSLKLVQ
jgi:hypothetical protein